MNVEMINSYSYNNRNWITSMEGEKDLFNYENTYFKNGNVKSQYLTGEYSYSFSDNSDLSFTYIYDKSNRLTQTSTSDKSYELLNTYDKDGNILTLDRNGSTGNSIDDFNYSYYSGTNKLSKVKGSNNQFAYDSNGNLITDSLNSNFSIHYDHRNLITDLIQRVIEVSAITPADTSFYKTYYYYDEAGNRIRKKIFNDENDSLLSDIIYSRDVSGKEMAIYENGSLKQRNIWGMDNAGFINANGDKRFYLKDHLGSVRAEIDDGGSLISAQDYDAWGYQQQDRSYNSEESVYKFTSKERDDENKYDYFGARYYDARVGRWGSIDKLQEVYFSFTPYNYALLNPLKYVDPIGLTVDLPENEGQRNKVLISLRLGLPSWAEKYIDSKLVGDKYIIDQELLNSAPITISDSQELKELLEVVNSSEITKIIGIKTGESIKYLNSNNKTDKDVIPKSQLGETLISGNTPNSNTLSGVKKSLTGRNEVYLNMSKNQESMTIGLTHELLSHVNSYIKGEQFQHGTLGDQFQNKMERIYENTLKNFHNR